MFLFYDSWLWYIYLHDIFIYIEFKHQFINVRGGPRNELGFPPLKVKKSQTSFARKLPGQPWLSLSLLTCQPLSLLVKLHTYWMSLSCKINLSWWMVVETFCLGGLLNQLKISKLYIWLSKRTVYWPSSSCHCYISCSILLVQCILF